MFRIEWLLFTKAGLNFGQRWKQRDDAHLVFCHLLGSKMGRTCPKILSYALLQCCSRSFSLVVLENSSVDVDSRPDPSSMVIGRAHELATQLWLSFLYERESFAGAEIRFQKVTTSTEHGELDDRSHLGRWLRVNR